MLQFSNRNISKSTKVLKWVSNDSYLYAVTCLLIWLTCMLLRSRIVVYLLIWQLHMPLLPSFACLHMQFSSQHTRLKTLNDAHMHAEMIRTLQMNRCIHTYKQQSNDFERIAALHSYY